MTGVIETALSDTPVVVLNGPRQSGKSTLARELVRQGALKEYRTFDSAADLATARGDPDGFVRTLGGAAVIDEVQHVPDLFRAIKLSVDEDRRPGRFLLTGSVDVRLAPRIAESLAGRVELHTLWPLSQGEIDGVREGFVEAVFAHELPAYREDRELRGDLADRIVRSCFPDLIRRPAERRGPWFESYITTSLQRDVESLADVDALASMPRLVSLIAARTGSLLNVAEVSRSSQLPHTTLRRYLALLEAAFLIRRVPAWSGGLGRRLLKHPRVILSDAGLAAHLQRVDARRIATTEPVLIGPLIENFVAMELTKQLSWRTGFAHLYHFRAAAGEEVDLVLERRGGGIVGIELKASSTVGGTDFRGLRALASRAGERFVRGVLLYTGHQGLPFGPRMCALPISALWRL